MQNSQSLYHWMFVSDSCSLVLHLPHQTPIIPSVSAAVASNNSFMSEYDWLHSIMILQQQKKNTDNYNLLMTV